MELVRAHIVPDRDVRVVGGVHSYRVNLRPLLTYLPGIPDHYGGAIPGTIDLNEIIGKNAGLYTQHRLAESMRSCLHTLLASLERNVDRSETPGIDMMTWLEQNFAGTFYTKAMRDSARAYSQSYVHEQAFDKFAALAVLSKFTRSGRLFAILGQFFVKYAKKLFYVEHNVIAAFRWCTCIIRYLPPAQRTTCLRELVINYPDVINQLRVAAYRSSSTDARKVVDVLRNVIDNMEENDRRRLHRDSDDIFEQRGRRRIRDDWWDDDDEALFRLERRTSASPLRRRRLLIEETPRTFDHDLDEVLRDLGVGTRRHHALSSTSEQRLRRLENRMNGLEETVTWLGTEELVDMARTQGMRSIGPRRSTFLLEY